MRHARWHRLREWLSKFTSIQADPPIDDSRGDVAGEAAASPRDRGRHHARRLASTAGRAWPRALICVLLIVAGIGLTERLLFGQGKDSALYVDNQGRVGIGTTGPQAALDVAGTVRAQSFEGIGAVPKGAVLMWSGAANAIPAGWALCDGDKGTPDLRGRFVLGAGKGANLTERKVGDKGGEESHLLTEQEMPAHDHGPSEHTHTYRMTQGKVVGSVGGKGQAAITNWADQATGPSSHTHARVGGNAPHPIMPPYYALAFIMKVQ